MNFSWPESRITYPFGRNELPYIGNAAILAAITGLVSYIVLLYVLHSENTYKQPSFRLHKGVAYADIGQSLCLLYGLTSEFHLMRNCVWPIF